MKSNSILNTIAKLDLDPIKTKLMQVGSGEGWSRAKADAMEVEYRRFLHLMHAFPQEEAAPTKAVDTFWHYHILHTEKYAADCDAVFGHFMHHDPLGAEENADVGERAGTRMQELYEATFGEAYIRPEVYGIGEAGTTAAASAPCITSGACLRKMVPVSAGGATRGMRQPARASVSSPDARH